MSTVEINAEHVANILHIFNQSSFDERTSGAAWYGAAKLVCNEMSIKYNVPVPVVVAVVAALSPNNRWERNLANADALIAAFLNGDECETVSCSTYHSMRAKAWRCLEIGAAVSGHFHGHLDGLLLAELKGQKISAFYQNIAGTSDKPTIDGHAANIARGRRVSLSGSRLTITKRQYRELQAAYVEAARVLNCDLTGYEVQAVTWTAWRRIHNI